MPAKPPYPYLWRVKTRLPERKGTRLRVIVRGGMRKASNRKDDHD